MTDLSIAIKQTLATLKLEEKLAPGSVDCAQQGTSLRLVFNIPSSNPTPYEALAKQAETALLALEGVEKVQVMLAAHKESPKIGASSTKALPRGVKHVLAVTSGKGGVGKSMVAVNLALALLKQNLSVGILDADIYGPSLPLMLGASYEPVGNEEGRLIPLTAHGMACMSIGYLVPPQSPVIWRGPMVHSAMKQLLHDVEWPQLDVLVVDMPPGTGDAALSLAQLVPLSGAAVVTTPQDLALSDVRKGIAMYQKMNVPILGMIENMSGFTCPHCQNVTPLFGQGGGQAGAEELGIPFLGAIPLHMALRESADKGEPLMACDPQSEQAVVFVEMAQKLKGHFA
ncbi:MAG: Mrp/NBP35 family ATP-binding protein [Alphaproteobacteria bacterium]|nr:Mrp/NBP35 family ATP-binding protein [Alphaproteobacteria bacterium]